MKTNKYSKWTMLEKMMARNNKSPKLRYRLEHVKLLNDGHSGGVIKFLQQNPNWPKSVGKVTAEDGMNHTSVFWDNTQSWRNDGWYIKE